MVFVGGMSTKISFAPLIPLDNCYFWFAKILSAHPEILKVRRPWVCMYVCMYVCIYVGMQGCMEVCVCLHVGMYVYCLAGCLDGSWDIWVVLIGLGCLGRRARNQGRKTGSKQACKHEVQGKDTPTSAGESPARPDCKGNQGKDLAERSPTAEVHPD